MVGIGEPFTWVRNVVGPARLQRAIALIPPEPRDAEAHDRFGKPTPIELRDAGGGLDAAPAIRITFSWPDRNKDPEEVPVLEYYEIERTTETVRISNPEDSAQYVDVERVLTIMFEGPDGRRHNFNLKYGD